MSGTPETTWDQVRAWRMRRHFLADRDGPGALGVVTRLGGVQAQVTSSAEQAVAVRTARGDLGPVLEAREVVRTWAMRGTLHLLAATDAPSVLALLAAARSWEKGAWQREFATAGQIADLATAVDEVLADAVLTREELVAALPDHLRDADLAAKLSSGWGPLLKPLAWQGVLVNGPARGTRPTFTSPRTWLPGWPGLPDPDVAATRAIPAYLGAHGPATPATVDAWLLRGAMPKARLKRWFADLVADGTLTTVTVEGAELHVRTDDVDGLLAAEPVPGVRLLPGFDQYVLGPGTNHEPVVPPAHRSRVSRAAGWIAPVVVADGRVVATWSSNGDTLAVEPFPDTPVPAHDDLETAREVWDAVLGRPTTLRVAPVRVAPS